MCPSFVSIESSYSRLPFGTTVTLHTSPRRPWRSRALKSECIGGGSLEVFQDLDREQSRAGDHHHKDRCHLGRYSFLTDPRSFSGDSAPLGLGQRGSYPGFCPGPVCGCSTDSQRPTHSHGIQVHSDFPNQRQLHERIRRHSSLAEHFASRQPVKAVLRLTPPGLNRNP